MRGRRKRHKGRGKGRNTFATTKEGRLFIGARTKEEGRRARERESEEKKKRKKRKKKEKVRGPRGSVT